MLRNQKITDLTLDDFHLVINVNLLGAVLVAKHAIPVMQRQGSGVICFTTSVADASFRAKKSCWMEWS